MCIRDRTGFIGSADFDQLDAAFFHDIGNAEALPDLHQLTAGAVYKRQL